MAMASCERSRHGGSTRTGNPLKEDPLLEQLLLEQSQKIDIESSQPDNFDSWKASFVQRLESLLESQGIVKARDAYEKVKENLKVLEAFGFKLQNEIDQGGHLGGSGNDGGGDGNAEVIMAVSDKGRQALNQAMQGVMEATRHIREWLPAKDDDDEKKLGYNKYHLCVVLVKDDFDVYLTMSLIRDMLKQAFDKACKDAAVPAADEQGVWQAMAHFEQELQCFCDFVIHDLELYEIMQKSTSKSKKETCIGQHPTGPGAGGIDEHTEQSNNEHQTQQRRPPPSSSSSLLLPRRRRSLLGNFDKNQQSHQPQRARRRSLEIADLESLDDSGAVAASFEEETVENEKSFDTIEYYTDDDEEEIVESNEEKSFDTLEYYTDDGGDDSVGAAPFEKQDIVENEKSFNALEYDEETIENSDKSINTLEYEEEMDNLATLECQEDELVDFKREDLFGIAPDEKVSESAVDGEACEVNEEGDEIDNEEGPLSLQPPYLRNQADFADVLGDGSLPHPHLSNDPSPEQQEPPPAQLGPSVFTRNMTGTSSIISNEDDDDDVSTREEDSDPILQFDPSVITCNSPDTGTGIVSSEDDYGADTHEVIREDSDPYLQFDPSDVAYSSSIAANEDDQDADTHEVTREDSDPYLQFDPSDIACSSSIVSNENENNVDTQDVSCEDTGGKPSAPSRGKRIRKMFGSLISRPSKLHIDQSEDVARSPSRTVDENGEEQSCNLDAAGNLRGPEDDDKEESIQPLLSSLGLTQQSERVLSPEQPLPRASKPKEQSVEQAFQCDAAAPPSPSNRANRFNGIFKSLSSKALSPRRENKSKSIENIESPMPQLHKDSEPNELPMGSPPDQQEFQSDDEEPPSPTNEANRFHEIFKGLMIHSPKQEQVECSMSLIQKDKNMTAPFPAKQLPILKSTKKDHVPVEEQQMTRECLPVEELQLQSPPFCNNLESPIRAKKVSFKLPENHGKLPSAGRCRRRPGSPRRRRTDSRPGSPPRKRPARTGVSNGVVDQDGSVTSASPLSSREELQLQSPPFCDKLDMPVRKAQEVEIKSPQAQRQPPSSARGRPASPRRRNTDSSPGSPPHKRHSATRAVRKGASNGIGDAIRWDLRVRFGSPAREAYNKPLRHDDCVLVPDFFGPTSDWSTYYKLLVEIQQLQERNIAGSNLIQCLQDVGKHLVCPTPMKSKTFKEVCKKVCTYFGIKLETVQFTLNWYRDNTDMQKPRHDEEAYENDKPSIRNITVGISFGAERELSLEKHEANGKDLDRSKLVARISIPQSNNCVCTIGRDVNIRFKNGLVQSENGTGGGTIGIILWGQVQNVKEEKGSPAKLKRDPVQVPF